MITFNFFYIAHQHILSVKWLSLNIKIHCWKVLHCEHRTKCCNHISSIKITSIACHLHKHIWTQAIPFGPYLLIRQHPLFKHSFSLVRSSPTSVEWRRRNFKMRSAYAHKYPSVFLRDPKHVVEPTHTSSYPTSVTSAHLEEVRVISLILIATTGSEWQIRWMSPNTHTHTHTHSSYKKGCKCLSSSVFMLSPCHSLSLSLSWPNPPCRFSGHIWWRQNDTRPTQSTTIV